MALSILARIEEYRCRLTAAEVERCHQALSAADGIHTVAGLDQLLATLNIHTLSRTAHWQAELEELFGEPRVLDLDLLLYIVTREKAFHLQLQQPDTTAELYDVFNAVAVKDPRTLEPSEIEQEALADLLTNFGLEVDVEGLLAEADELGDGNGRVDFNEFVHVVLDEQEVNQGVARMDADFQQLKARNAVNTATLDELISRYLSLLPQEYVSHYFQTRVMPMLARWEQGPGADVVKLLNWSKRINRRRSFVQSLGFPSDHGRSGRTGRSSAESERSLPSSPGTAGLSLKSSFNFMDFKSADFKSLDRKPSGFMEWGRNSGSSTPDRSQSPEDRRSPQDERMIQKELRRRLRRERLMKQLFSGACPEVPEDLTPVLRGRMEKLLERHDRFIERHRVDHPIPVKKAAPLRATWTPRQTLRYCEARRLHCSQASTARTDLQASMPTYSRVCTASATWGPGTADSPRPSLALHRPCPPADARCAPSPPRARPLPPPGTRPVSARVRPSTGAPRTVAQVPRLPLARPQRAQSAAVHRPSTATQRPSPAAMRGSATPVLYPDFASSAASLDPLLSVAGPAQDLPPNTGDDTAGPALPSFAAPRGVSTTTPKPFRRDVHSATITRRLPCSPAPYAATKSAIYNLPFQATQACH